MDEGSYSSSQFSSEFINSEVWDKGKAEIAYYLLNRIDTLYQNGQLHISRHSDTFEISIVKQLYDFTHFKKSMGSGNNTAEVFSVIQRRIKGPLYSGQSASSSIHLLKKNLMPVKVSIAEYSLEGNSFNEQRFRSGTIEQVTVGDGAKKYDAQYNLDQNYYSIEQIPLLVRALDFSKQSEYSFPIVNISSGESAVTRLFFGDNKFDVTITLMGEEELVETGGIRYVNKVKVSYPNDVFPPTKVLGHMIPAEEFYFISKDQTRQIIRIRSRSGQFKSLQNEVKSSYTLDLLGSSFIDWWNMGENLYLKPFLRKGIDGKSN